MSIEEQIDALMQRNQKVEADKAWETSHTRKILVLLITYVLATVVMYVIGVEKPYLSALIPSLGFFLSTLSLGVCKKVWLKKIYSKSRAAE